MISRFHRLADQRKVLASYLVVAIAALGISFPLVFATLAPYDDESYVMMTIRSFAEGHPLYSDTFTQYGPAFYLIVEPVHSILGLPLTHDAVRLKTAVIWCLSCLLVFQIIRRMSGNTLAALAASLLVAMHLEKLALEPGHPQELVLLLWLIAIRLTLEQSSTRWWLLGLLAALLGMTKVNCGSVLVLAVLLASLSGRSMTSRLLRLLAYGITLLLPLGLVMQSIQGNRSPMLALILVLGIVCLAWFDLSPMTKQSRGWKSGSLLRWRDFERTVTFMLGGILGTIGIVVWSVANGNDLRQIVWGVVGQHTQFTSTFFHTVSISTWMILACLGSFAVWAFAQVVPSEKPADESKSGWKLFCVLYVWCFTALLIYKSSGQPLEHGLQVRGAAAWLAVMGPSIAVWLLQRNRCREGRITLAAMVCLGPLIAFPTPGTQLSIGTVPAILALGVLLGDVLHHATVAMPQGSSQSAWSHKLTHWGLALAMVLVPLQITLSSIQYLRNDPLGLPGASLVRLPTALAREQQAIVRSIQRSDSEYLAFDGHNHNRFYFWTNRKPLNATNPTFWPRLLDHDRLAQLAVRLDQADSVCVVLVPERNELAGQHAHEYRQKLIQNWQPVDTVGDWSIGVRSNLPRPENSVKNSGRHSRPDGDKAFVGLKNKPTALTP